MQSQVTIWFAKRIGQTSCHYVTSTTLLTPIHNVFVFTPLSSPPLPILCDGFSGVEFACPSPTL